MPEKFEVMFSTLRNMFFVPGFVPRQLFAPQKAAKRPISYEAAATQRLFITATR
ncbi:MAG: hypothetical protein LUG14_11770 [Synergistaceae bacterium]|nr:hypothetical protein [Synergistaceae bacterium]